MTRRILLFLSAVLFTGNINAFKSRILNGQDANIEDFPYQVSLRIDSIIICGGSIISDNHILTAGHCFRSFDESLYDYIEIISGASYLSEKGNTHKILNVTIHPDFWTDGYSALHDIAVITLKDKIIFDKYQQKISLPEHDYEVGQKANLTGWGSIDLYATDPDQLQHLATRIISQDECLKKSAKPEKEKITVSDLCTLNENGKGACHGDSGGPLASDGVVIGIVSRHSWGGNCGDGHPAFYTNVYNYKQFIESIMNEKN